MLWSVFLWSWSITNHWNHWHWNSKCHSWSWQLARENIPHLSHSSTEHYPIIFKTNALLFFSHYLSSWSMFFIDHSRMFFVSIKLTGLSQVCISCVTLGFLQSLFFLFFITFPQRFLGTLFSPTVVSLQLIMLVVAHLSQCPHLICIDISAFFLFKIWVGTPFFK